MIVIGKAVIFAFLYNTIFIIFTEYCYFSEHSISSVNIIYTFKCFCIINTICFRRFRFYKHISCLYITQAYVYFIVFRYIVYINFFKNCISVIVQ